MPKNNCHLKIHGLQRYYGHLTALAGVDLELSPSIHKFSNKFILSGFSAALGHELGPNGVSILLTEDGLISGSVIANRSTNQRRDDKGTSILLVEQNASSALDIADYGYVMENWRISMDVSRSEFQENKDEQEFNMG